VLFLCATSIIVICAVGSLWVVVLVGLCEEWQTIRNEELVKDVGDESLEREDKA